MSVVNRNDNLDDGFVKHSVSYGFISHNDKIPSEPDPLRSISLYHDKSTVPSIKKQVSVSPETTLISEPPLHSKSMGIYLKTNANEIDECIFLLFYSIIIK